MAHRSTNQEALVLVLTLVLALGLTVVAVCLLQGVRFGSEWLQAFLESDGPFWQRAVTWIGASILVVVTVALAVLVPWAKYPRGKQAVLAALAVTMVSAAGALPGPELSRISQQAQLVPPENALARTRPEVAVLSMAPGGTRAVMFSYLWMRAGELHQEGKHHDAYQLARLICMMQPRFPGVWDYQSWQMAWNISVTCDNAEERWQWIYNGIKLVRDEGLEANPTSIKLYDRIAWTFLEKMQGDMDDFHVDYKKRWAKIMQDVLTPNVYGTTREVIDAFRPIGQQPIDRALTHRVGKDGGYVQRDQLAWITRDKPFGQDTPGPLYHPKAGEYVAKLAALGVSIDQGLLAVYNRYSLDENVMMARSGDRRVEPDRDDTRAHALYTLINDANYTEPRNALLAFVRAQVLWNRFKMDPKLMLKVMIDRNVPLDWRLPVAHALYWVEHGKAAVGYHKKDIQGMRVDRMLMNSMKDLTWFARISYRENPTNPDYPEVANFPDWRYMEPGHQEHIRLATEWANAPGKPGEHRTFAKSKYRDGHVNYLVACVNTLYFLRRYEQANRYLNWIRTTYKPVGPQWELSLPEFVYWQLTAADIQQMPSMAMAQLSASLESALVSLALGDRKDYAKFQAHAVRVYAAYRRAVRDWSRKGLRPLDVLAAQKLSMLLVRPRALGYNLSLSQRIDLFRDLESAWTPARGMPHPCALVYDGVARELRRQCEAADEVFEQAFPPPPGLAELREKRSAPNLRSGSRR